MKRATLFARTCSAPLSGEVRMAIDFGSGSVEAHIADVYSEEADSYRKIKKRKFELQLKAELERSDNRFNEQVLNKVIRVVEDIKTFAGQYGVQRVLATGTAVFRQAEPDSKDWFIEQLEERTGLAINVIEQREEGEIGFYAAECNLKRQGVECGAEELIVVDVGGGSAQVTTKQKGEGDGLSVIEYQIGSESFKLRVIKLQRMFEAGLIIGDLETFDKMKVIQGDSSPLTPNPMTFLHSKKAVELLSRTQHVINPEKYFPLYIVANFLRNLRPASSKEIQHLPFSEPGCREEVFKTFELEEKKVNRAKLVVGIGRLFTYSILSCIRGGADNTIYRYALESFLDRALNKSDPEIAAETGDKYPEVNVTNAALILGLMKRWGVESLKVINTSIGDGLLTFPRVWEKEGGYAMDWPLNESFCNTEPLVSRL